MPRTGRGRHCGVSAPAHAAMRYVRIIGRTEADLLRGRGPSLQAARQGIAGARGDCESGLCADHGAWSRRRGEPARVTAVIWSAVGGASALVS